MTELADADATLARRIEPGTARRVQDSAGTIIRGCLGRARAGQAPARGLSPAAIAGLDPLITRPGTRRAPLA